MRRSKPNEGFLILSPVIDVTVPFSSPNFLQGDEKCLATVTSLGAN